MTTVAVTGAAGYIGRRVVESLAAREDVTRVVGIDQRDPGYSTRNLEFYRLDVRSPSIKDAVNGCDALVHLAFVLQPQRDEPQMRDVNVGGSTNVFHAAIAGGVRRIVYTSSVMAYGAHPDNDFPLTEDSPIRGVRDFSYSAHKDEVEGIVADLVEAHPDVAFTILRPSYVFGPHISGAVAAIVELPVFPVIEGYSPPMQFVHEDDVARAILFALDHDLRGPYNVCPDGWLQQDLVIEILGKRRAVADYESAHRRADRMWQLGLAPVPPGYLPFQMYPWVMSNKKIIDAGFRFEHSNEDALRSAVEARRGWISIGRLRFRPRKVAALAGAAVVAGSLLKRRFAPRIDARG